MVIPAKKDVSIRIRLRVTTSLTVMAIQTLLGTTEVMVSISVHKVVLEAFLS